MPFHSTNNPQTIDKAQIILDAHRLVTAVQKRIDSKVVVIPSRDKDENLRGIEIVLWYETGQGRSDMANIVNEEAIKLGLIYKTFVMGTPIIRDYTPKQITNIREANTIINSAPTISKPDIESLINYNSSSTAAPVYDGIQTVPQNQLMKPFLLSRATLEEFQVATGANLKLVEHKIKDLLASLNKTSVVERKTGFQVLEVAAGGVIGFATGIGVSKLITATGSFLSFFATASAAAGVTAAAFVPAGIVLGALIALTAGAYLLVNDVINILLVANNTSDDVICKGDSILNGQRVGITSVIPSKKDIPGSWVCAGLYVYSKYKISSKSFSGFGSLVGVGFTKGQDKFAIGMDCPNSGIGGTNSIRVGSGDAYETAILAGRSNNETDNISFSDGGVAVKRAKRWGNINWGFGEVKGK